MAVAMLPFKIIVKALLRPRAHEGKNLPNNLVFWQIIPFWGVNLQESGAFFAHVYEA